MRTGSSDECRVEWREKANTKRSITVLTLCAMLLLLCSSTEAKQAGKVPRIGYVAENPGSLVEAFRQGLRDLGYIEAKNILVEYRYAEGVRAVFQASWPNSCDSSSMCLSSTIHPRSMQPSRHMRKTAGL
jgi:hypothetical protein